MERLKGKEEVSYHSLSEKDWEEYDKAKESFESFEIPSFCKENDPNHYVFFALCDGTENDLKNPSEYTNVAKLKEELEKNELPNVGFYYKEGVGTYEGKESLLKRVLAKLDAIFSFTKNRRVKEIYNQFTKQANTWRKENPNAEISIVQVGFSRGSGIATLLNQMIHKEGIVDKITKKMINGKLELTGDYLVKPGEIKQATLLYDSVTTLMRENLLKKDNFVLSSSTISALEINAKDEFRSLFPLTNICRDKNQLSLTLPGCHTDIGGGYKENGLSLYAKNIADNYLKKIFPQLKNLKETILPSKDSSLNVVHHSEEHKFFYRKVEERQVIRGDKEKYLEYENSLNIKNREKKDLSYERIKIKENIKEETVSSKVSSFLRNRESKENQLSKNIYINKNKKTISSKSYCR